MRDSGAVAIRGHGREWWAEEAIGIAECPSRWQQVLHGESLGFRVAVLEELSEAWGGKRSKCFALCGRGDRIAKNESGGVAVQPYGCGEPLCPRCSRRRGIRVLRALDHRFREIGHASLYHLVLTQRVYQEPLSRTKTRMEEMWKRAQRRLKRLGPIGMLCVAHCTWSRHGGFHYHLHVIAEFEGEPDLGGFSEWWGTLAPGQQPGFAKRVATPRTARQCGLPQDLIHGVDAVGSGIGYIVGDVIKGVGRFGTDGCPRNRLAEVVETVTGLKRQRLYGDWRGAIGKCERHLKAERQAQDAQGVSDESKETAVSHYDGMLVDDAYFEATQGEPHARELVRGLFDRYPGSSFLSDSVRGFCLEALVER